MAKRVQYQAEFLQRSNVNVCIVIPLKGISGILSGVSYYYGKLNSLNRIYKCRGNHRINILVTQTLIGAKEFVYVLFAKMLGYRIVMDKVELFNFLEDRMSFRQKMDIKIGLFMDNFINWFAGGIIVISTLLYEKYRDIGIPILLLPNSVPHSLIVKNNKNKFNNPVRMVYAGSYGKKDGVEYLIRAFKKLVQHYDNVELHLVGKGTNENHQRIKNEIGTGEFVIYEHGYVDEDKLQNILLDADILAVTRTNSKYANFGFPYKLTEYLCKGNPVLATQVGDISLYLEDKKNIVFANAEDTDSLCEAMEYCLTNEKQLIRLGRRGQKVIQKFFSIEKNGKFLLDFILAL